MRELEVGCQAMIVDRQQCRLMKLLGFTPEPHDDYLGRVVTVLALSAGGDCPCCCVVDAPWIPDDPDYSHGFRTLPENLLRIDGMEDDDASEEREATPFHGRRATPETAGAVHPDGDDGESTGGLRQEAGEEEEKASPQQISLFADTCPVCEAVRNARASGWKWKLHACSVCDGWEAVLPHIIDTSETPSP